MALLGAIGGSGYAGYRFVTTSSRFAIDDIQIRGNHHLTLDQVRQTLPVAVGDNVFTTDLDTVVRERARPAQELVDLVFSELDAFTDLVQDDRTLLLLRR